MLQAYTDGASIRMLPITIIFIAAPATIIDNV